MPLNKETKPDQSKQILKNYKSAIIQCIGWSIDFNGISIWGYLMLQG